MGARFLRLGLGQSRLGLQQRVLGRLQVEGGHHLVVEERLLAVGGHAGGGHGRLGAAHVGHGRFQCRLVGHLVDDEQFFYLANTHCREQHEVGWYARQVGLSPDALSAALKRFCGKTAGAILTELLTEEAKVCLRNPSLSVQEVAEMLHFADQSAFGKFFKRQCGVSPMQYKKETEQPG